MDVQAPLACGPNRRSAQASRPQGCPVFTGLGDDGENELSCGNPEACPVPTPRPRGVSPDGTRDSADSARLTCGVVIAVISVVSVLDPAHRPVSASPPRSSLQSIKNRCRSDGTSDRELLASASPSHAAPHVSGQPLNSFAVKPRNVCVSSWDKGYLMMGARKALTATTRARQPCGPRAIDGNRPQSPRS